MDKKKWLIFGAGGIGRGLIAPIAQDSDYAIIVASHNTEQVRFFTKYPQYRALFYSPKGCDLIPAVEFKHRSLLSVKPSRSL